MAFRDHIIKYWAYHPTQQRLILKRSSGTALQYHPDRNAESDLQSRISGKYRKHTNSLTYITEVCTTGNGDCIFRKNAETIRQHTPESILEESMAFCRQIKEYIYRMNNETIFSTRQKEFFQTTTWTCSCSIKKKISITALFQK